MKSAENTNSNSNSSLMIVGIIIGFFIIVTLGVIMIP